MLISERKPILKLNYLDFNKTCATIWNGPLIGHGAKFVDYPFFLKNVIRE